MCGLVQPSADEGDAAGVEPSQGHRHSGVIGRDIIAWVMQHQVQAFRRHFPGECKSKVLHAVRVTVKSSKTCSKLGENERDTFAVSSNHVTQGCAQRVLQPKCRSEYGRIMMLE